MEPFLNRKIGQEVFAKLNEFRTLCDKMASAKMDVIESDEDRKSYQQLTLQLASLKLYFKNILFSELFDAEPKSWLGESEGQIPNSGTIAGPFGTKAAAVEDAHQAAVTPDAGGQRWA
jgi:hypothetical protein